MAGDVGEADPLETRTEGRRRVARADAAFDLARRNRDFLAADVADRLGEVGLQRARTAHRYAMAEAALNYAVAVRETARGEAQALDTNEIGAHSRSADPGAEIERGLSPAGPLTARPVGISVLPGAPLIESGFWALLRKYDGRVTSVPLGPSTDVVVAIVPPTEHASLPPRMDQPMVVMVPDRATAKTVSRQGAVAVPLWTNGAQLIAVLETARTIEPAPSSTDQADVTPPLSLREAQVLTLICAGLTNAEIAAQLYLSINSIKTYVRTAYRKLGVTRRAEAVLWGFRDGHGTPTTPLARRP